MTFNRLILKPCLNCNKCAQMVNVVFEVLLFFLLSFLLYRLKSIISIPIVFTKLKCTF